MDDRLLTLFFGQPDFLPQRSTQKVGKRDSVVVKTWNRFPMKKLVE